MQPHRWQPTMLPRHWDSPGKNTGVGCHFLLQCRKVKSESEVAQSCPTLSDPMDCRLPGSSVHGIFQARVLEWGDIAFSDPTVPLSPNACDKPPLLNMVGSTEMNRVVLTSLLWVTGQRTVFLKAAAPNSLCQNHLDLLKMPSPEPSSQRFWCSDSAVVPWNLHF